ncbi:MAG: D-2-hydroxyacid dehydrogenase [Spirochaetaceae bacterium]|nr:MAG: D-2-hydroxyacid dehydrogenase [Spirochaetaceae bacterium]
MNRALVFKGVPMIVVLWVHSKVFINFRLGENHFRRLRRTFPDFTFIGCESKEQFLEALPKADVACAFRFKAEWFSKAPRLRRFISPTAGREGFPADMPPGVELEFSTFHGKIMAETVVGMMLSHARGLLRAYSLQSREAWPNQKLEPGLKLLAGSCVTILGFGHIGAYIGGLLKSFGVGITGVRRNPGASPQYFTHGDRLLPAARLDEVLPETDHLVLCLPATEETTGILDRRRLDLLPANAGIYNVGRGNALDEEALSDLLRERPLCEAYLDVFREEPLSDESPLRSLPNCLILPHVSANAPEYVDMFVDELIERLSSE